MKQLASEDMRFSKTRINMKLGKIFKGKSNNTEIALVVKNVTNEFENTRLRNVFDQQTYISLKTEFE
jgi:hypothetical protein